MLQLIYNADAQRWELQLAARKRKDKCVVRGCGRSRPAYGRVCSRCLMARWRANNPVQAAFAALRHHAKARKIACALTLVEFREWATRVGYIDKRGRVVGTYHVDRIDATGGYELSNIQLLPIEDNCGAKAQREKRAAAKLRAQGVDCELTRRYPAETNNDEGDPF